PGHHQPGGFVMTCSESHFRVDLNFKPKSGIGFVKRSPDPALVSDDDGTEITFPNLVPVFRFDQTEFVCEYTLLTRNRDFLNRSLEPAFRKMGLPDIGIEADAGFQKGFIPCFPQSGNEQVLLDASRF